MGERSINLHIGENVRSILFEIQFILPFLETIIESILIAFRNRVLTKSYKHLTSNILKTKTFLNACRSFSDFKKFLIEKREKKINSSLT